MRRAKSIVLILALLPAMAVAKEQIRDATIREINSHEQEYAGKMVRVRGHVVRGMEWFGIEAEKCTLYVDFPIEPADLADMKASHLYLEHLH